MDGLTPPPIPDGKPYLEMVDEAAGERSEAADREEDRRGDP